MRKIVSLVLIVIIILSLFLSLLLFFGYFKENENNISITNITYNPKNPVYYEKIQISFKITMDENHTIYFQQQGTYKEDNEYAINDSFPLGQGFATQGVGNTSRDYYHNASALYYDKIRFRIYIVEKGIELKSSKWINIEIMPYNKTPKLTKIYYSPDQPQSNEEISYFASLETEYNISYRIWLFYHVDYPSGGSNDSFYAMEIKYNNRTLCEYIKKIPGEIIGSKVTYYLDVIMVDTGNIIITSNEYSFYIS